MVSEPQMIQILGSYDPNNVIVLPPYYIGDAVAFGYNNTCTAFDTCFNSTRGLRGLYPAKDYQPLNQSGIEILSRPDAGWVTNFNMSEGIQLSVGGLVNQTGTGLEPCLPGRPFCTVFVNSTEGRNMVLANDLRLDMNMLKLYDGSKKRPLAGSINWPNMYETLLTSGMRRTYAAAAVYIAGVNHTVRLSELVVYIEQNCTKKGSSITLSNMLKNNNMSTTLCIDEPICSIDVKDITGSARLARVSIVNNDFRLESINVYTSDATCTTVASVNLTFSGYIANLGEVYSQLILPSYSDVLVFSNTSMGDTRQDTKILKNPWIDTVFYTGYGWSGATVSYYGVSENGVQYEGLRAFEPPLALTIAKFVEQDKANVISPNSAGNVQLRPSISSSRLFLTVNGKPLMTTDAAVSENLSLVGTNLDEDK
ncbi:unnamed protein product [Umbelopsis ramanniana]